MSYSRFRIVAAAWLVFVFMGCGGGESSAAVPVESGSTARLTVSSTGGGVIASTPRGIICGTTCAASFPMGTTVKLTAVPLEQHQFIGWGGACSGTGVCSVAMGAESTVTATFVTGKYRLTTTATGAGTIKSAPAGIDCGATCVAGFAYGTMVSLSATPEAGSTFGGWTGACSGTGACSVAMDAAKSVSANFTAGNYALTVTRIGGGTVTSTPAGIDCGSTCSASYKPGVAVTMTATPSAGYTFTSWSGSCTGSGAGTGKCTVTMSGPRAVTATFTSTGGGGGGTDGACSGFYPDGFQLVSGQVVLPWPTSAKPARGATVKEPQYKTCEVRATDHRVDGLNTFARNDYARRQAFNTDNTRQLVYALDGFWHLYDPVSYKHLKVLPGLAGDSEPQWHPTDPNLLYYLPTNGVGMKVYRLDVNTGVSTLVGDLSARLRARWPTANSAWTKSEGSPSADGRYWCFMVDSGSWTGLGIVTWDMETNTILGMHDVNGERPDHVSMSPSGNYCVSSSYGGPGVVAYSRDFSSSKKITNIGEHSDIGIDANGDDAFVSIDYQSAGGDIFMTNLRTGVRTVLFPTYVNGTASAVHFSAKSFRKPGWFVLSAYGESTNRPPYEQQWFHHKITVIQMAANPKIYNLASTHTDTLGYWTEPQASVNRDLTKIVWNSNWDINSDLDTDVYMIQIPPSAVK